MRGRRQSRYAMLVVYIVSSLYSASACAPKMVQVYPSTDVESDDSLTEAVDRIQRNTKIRFQMAGGPLTEAVYEERDASYIYVKQYVWKKQIIGKKKVLSDELTALAIMDLEQLHTSPRIGTAKKVAAYILGFGILVGIVWAMTPPSVE
jgi:hypothetical protein